jgi:hypothetical protein
MGMLGIARQWNRLSRAEAGNTLISLTVGCTAACGQTGARTLLVTWNESEGCKDEFAVALRYQRRRPFTRESRLKPLRTLRDHGPLRSIPYGS